MATSVGLTRQKISTTISPDSFAYLQHLIEANQARNLADAIDLAIGRLLKFENRERLEHDTAAYFEGMSSAAMEEENQLAAALGKSSSGIDFDREP